MKPLLILLRIALVGLFWSIFFIEGIRVILLTNWHFDIFRTAHWLHARNLWLSGWVIDEPKEWAFILIIFSAIPVWVTVWAALSTIHWEKLFSAAWAFLLKLLRRLFNPSDIELASSPAVVSVSKKPSYKQIRPRNIAPSVEETVSGVSAFDEERRAKLSGIPYKSKAPSVTPTAAPQKPKEFTHSLFDLSDPDPIDFDLFGDNEPETPTKTEDSSSKKSPKTSSAVTKQHKTGSANSTFEFLKSKGYDVITGATIQNTFIDFIGVSKSQICLCLNDKEPGDWLADEERFNDEEPLWFSESSHRISPVRKIDLARITLQEKLNDADLSFEIVPFVIEPIGNIINAEDMFDIWKEMNVNVTRIDRGTPKEIPLFAKTLEDADGNVDKSVFEKLKKLLRSIA